MKLTIAFYSISFLIYLTLITILLYVTNKDDPLMWSIYSVGLVLSLFSIHLATSDTPMLLLCLANFIGFAFIYSAFLKMSFIPSNYSNTYILYGGHAFNVFMFILTNCLLYSSLDSLPNNKHKMKEDFVNNPLHAKSKDIIIDKDLIIL